MFTPDRIIILGSIFSSYLPSFPTLTDMVSVNKALVTGGGGRQSAETERYVLDCLDVRVQDIFDRPGKMDGDCESWVVKQSH